MCCLPLEKRLLFFLFVLSVDSVSLLKTRIQKCQNFPSTNLRCDGAINTVIATLQNPAGHRNFLSLFIYYVFFFFLLEHNLRDCRSIMEFTVVDCMSPVSDVETPQSTTINLSRISCPYLINIVINDGCIVLNTARRNCASPRTSAVVVEFYFLIIGWKIYSSVLSVRCIGLRVHVLDHTHTHTHQCVY